MSQKRKALLETIMAAATMARTDAEGSVFLHAHREISKQPDTVAVPAAQFAHMIGADEPLAPMKIAA